MRSPKSNPTIEAIKAQLRQKIGYMPGDSIPNSRVSKQLELLDATATLEYAKSLNRKVRRAMPGECEAKNKEIYKQYQKQSNKPAGMFNSKEAAEKIGITCGNLGYYLSIDMIKSSKVGNRHYYSESEIVRFKASYRKTA